MSPAVGATELHALLTVLQSRPLASFSRIGGAVSFFVKSKDATSEHYFALEDGAIALCDGKPERWSVRIGIALGALKELVAGTLDVKRAVDDNRLAIDADAATLEKFAAAFAPAQSALDVRLRR